MLMLKRAGILGLMSVMLAGVLMSQDMLQDGYNRFYYGNGQISSEGMIRDGKPDGKWISYHVNGQVKSVGIRRNFQLDSIWSFYDEKGNITAEIEYKYGKRNGYHINYQNNIVDTLPPVVLSKELYLDNLKQGLAWYYKRDGSLDRVVRFKDGKQHGLTREYANDTLVRVVYTFHNDFMIDREVINQVDARGLRQGVWRDYYDNDNIKFEIHYKDGKRNGYYRTYSYTGKVSLSDCYEDDRLVEQQPGEGIEVEIVNSYDEEGNLTGSVGVMNNIPVGIHRQINRVKGTVTLREYDNSGQVVSTGNTTGEGLKDEFWQFFYPGGQVQSEGSFGADRRTGVWKFYYPDGKLEQQGNYVNGREEGLWTWYYPGGQIRREENYYRGMEDGLSVEYDEAGNIVSKGEYIEGYQEGEWFYHVGDHIEKGSYQGGLKSGEWKYYFHDEKIKFEGFYVQGLPNGKHRFYYENGKLKEEQYYSMGRKDRNWWIFDEDGNVVISYTYDNDVLIKVDGEKVNLEVER